MKVFVIAEAGVNHNGSIEIAKRLVDKAKEAGANAIKFQTFKAEKLVTKLLEKAEYQKKETEKDENQLEMLRKLELSYNDFEDLYEYTKLKGIEFLSTPFDLESIDFLSTLGMKRWKIPSGEITNLPYLLKIAKLKMPVILSTGMSTLEEIKIAAKILRENGVNDLTILHATTEYPAPFEEVNLNAMITIKNHLHLPIGYSDHTKGIEIPIAAVALGAEVIEKHFTLDRNMDGPDHKASIEPDELKRMVEAIRNVEKALGDNEKKPTKSEIKNIMVVRKSIVAKKKIKKGEIFTEENLTTKRPGNGISPMHWFDVIGRTAKRDFAEDELIEI